MRHIPDWDRYFLQLLPWIASRSKDPDTQVGAVIVAPDNSIVSTGYNSLPRGINDCAERLCRPEKYFWMEHAERNAIYSARGVPSGCRLYTSLLPCMDCGRAVVQTGIGEVVYDGDYQASREAAGKYVEDWKRVEQMFVEASVRVREVRL